MQLGPLSVQTEGHEMNRVEFEADQALGQNYLDKVPQPGPNRSLSWQASRLSLEDREAFLQAGNDALVSTLTIGLYPE